jgi:small GTP-binding protein
MKESEADTKVLVFVKAFKKFGFEMRFRRASQDAKVIIVGDAGVGKTSILTQFSCNIFNEVTESTVGAMFLSKQVDTSHGTINLMMWDTAGQERYRSLIPMYSRNAAAAILVVDVSHPDSYDGIELWYKLLKDECPNDTKIYIVANKIDLHVQIPIDKLEEWANDHGFPFFKTCSKRYETLEPIFQRIAEEAPAPPIVKVLPEKPSLDTAAERSADECC